MKNIYIKFNKNILFFTTFVIYNILYIYLANYLKTQLADKYHILHVNEESFSFGLLLELKISSLIFLLHMFRFSSLVR